MKMIAQQVADLQATRAAKAARMEAIAQKSIDEGRSMDEGETEEFDGIESEIESIDADLVRLSKLDKLMKSAKPAVVDPAERNPQKAATQQRETGPAIIVKKDQDEKFKGQNYTRLVIARAVAHMNMVSGHLGDACNPVAIAQKRWGRTNPTLVELVKAAVAGGGSDSGEWGAELVQADARYTGDFIEYLNSRTVFNQLPLREVPANIAIKGQDGAATGYWVGQSKGIPASKADFSTVNLTPLKVAALAVISNELLRDSTPAAEGLVRDALVEAAAQRIDTTFLGNVAASSGVSPAGLLNGVTGISSSGSDGDAVRADIKALYDVFIEAKNATGLWFVMNPSLAKALSLMTNALGQKEFAGLAASGGTLEGDPVVTGENVGGDDLILLKPSDIWKIGDGGVEVSMSRDATIEQDSAPQGASDTPVAASANLVNMFQTESTAIKVVRSMNFAKRRSHAVQYIEGAHYGSAST
jgi:HK97 family phage major capsid protein